MSWQAIVMYGVVVGIGIPAAFRNVTALAMVIAWLTVELVYQITGDSLPLRYSFAADIAVICAIYAKAIKRAGTKTYSSQMEQLRCMVTDLTLADRWIVAIFIFGTWPMYILQLDPWWQWMSLWALTIGQFLLAGSEAIAGFRTGRHKTMTHTPIIDRHLKIIPFPVRAADAVRIKPECSGALLARREGGYG